MLHVAERLETLGGAGRPIGGIYAAILRTLATLAYEGDRMSWEMLDVSAVSNANP
jgi:hypothetical protein